MVRCGDDRLNLGTSTWPLTGGSFVPKAIGQQTARTINEAKDLRSPELPRGLDAPGQGRCHFAGTTSSCPKKRLSLPKQKTDRLATRSILSQLVQLPEVVLESGPATRTGALWRARARRRAAGGLSPATRPRSWLGRPLGRAFGCRAFGGHPSNAPMDESNPSQIPGDPQCQFRAGVHARPPSVGPDNRDDRDPVSAPSSQVDQVDVEYDAGDPQVVEEVARGRAPKALEAALRVLDRTGDPELRREPE